MVSASSLVGAAGEYFVMSQLLRRGLIAALAPVGVPNCDIVVTDEIGDRLCAVQVKTRNNTGADGGWHMGKKHESLTSPSLFYCFSTASWILELAKMQAHLRMSFRLRLLRLPLLNLTVHGWRSRGSEDNSETTVICVASDRGMTT